MATMYRKQGKHAFIPDPSYTNPSMGITHMTAYRASASKPPAIKAKRLGETSTSTNAAQGGEWEGAGEYELYM
jgi:hypothetical protein